MEEIQVLLDSNKRQDEKLQSITNQLDFDRRDIDQLRIDQGTIKDQMKVIIDQLTDFKAEIRQQIEDSISTTIKRELPEQVKKAVKNELRLISQKNPKKVIERKIGIIEQVKLLFSKNK